jgi:glucitol operon activator protein
MKPITKKIERNLKICFKGDLIMNPVTLLIVSGIVMWILNFLLGMLQIKNFNKNYIELRKIGKVAIGRKKGYLQAGTIVMILIDQDGKIVSSRKMQGISVFARVRKFTGLEGMELGTITKEDLIKYNRFMRKAILDAINNYNIFKGGENGKTEEHNEKAQLAMN